MLGYITAADEIFIVTRKTDMRKSIDGLWAIVEQQLHMAPRRSALYAVYNPQTNSINITTFENYIVRIDCNKAEDGLKSAPCSQNSLDALAIDEPL